jgi:hypothetical protein
MPQRREVGDHSQPAGQLRQGEERRGEQHQRGHPEPERVVEGGIAGHGDRPRGDRCREARYWIVTFIARRKRPLRARRRGQASIKLPRTDERHVSGRLGVRGRP